jgi:hypothetical protein
MAKARDARNNALIIFFMVDDPPESPPLIHARLPVDERAGKRVQKSEQVILWNP